MIDEEFEFIKKNIKNLNLNEYKLNELETNTKYHIVTTRNVKRSVEKNKLNESYLFRLLTYLIQDSYQFIQKLEKLIVEMGKINKSIENNIEYNKNNEEEFLEDYILSRLTKKENEVDEELEKEMDLYVLADWQKNLVRSGEYKPWNFDTDSEEEMAQWGKYDKMD